MHSTENTTKSAGIVADLQSAWARLPNKWLFLGILASWILLFHFIGNPTLGYKKTNSLFGWMHFVYDSSPDDEHGILIPFLVAGLFWWKRKTLQEAMGEGWWPALGLVIFAALLHMLGFLVQQTRICIVAFFLGAYGMMGLAWGKEFMKRSFFPMFVFIFCIPLGTEAERITFPLRLFATKITAGLADGVFGIQVVRDGTRLLDPAGKYQYEVAAACSGIRSLTAIFIFTVVYSFVALQKNWKRLVMIGLTFPLAIVSNVVRLLMIIFAAEFFGQDAGTYVHDSGWLSMLPYIPSLVVVVLIGHKLSKSEPGVGLSSESAVPAT